MSAPDRAQPAGRINAQTALATAASGMPRTRRRRAAVTECLAMLKHPRQRETPDTHAISQQPPSPTPLPSFELRARPDDDGAMWPALAARCRQALPAQLQWAAPLLDPSDPLPVPCAESQVRELFRWLDGLPNTERVSIGCERHPAGKPERAAA